MFNSQHHVITQDSRKFSGTTADEKGTMQTKDKRHDTHEISTQSGMPTCQRSTVERGQKPWKT
jgi:hypothetical protein